MRVSGRWQQRRRREWKSKIIIRIIFINWNLFFCIVNMCLHNHPYMCRVWRGGGGGDGSDSDAYGFTSDEQRRFIQYWGARTLIVLKINTVVRSNSYKKTAWERMHDNWRAYDFLHLFVRHSTQTTQTTQKNEKIKLGVLAACVARKKKKTVA